MGNILLIQVSEPFSEFVCTNSQGRQVIEHTIKISPPFHDIDIMDVAWHGHYVKYFEVVRSELLAGIDLDWPLLRQLGIAMPIVKLEIKYRGGLSYGHEYYVKVLVDECEYPELVLKYEVKDVAGKLCTQGLTKQVYVNTQDMSSYMTIPEEVRHRMVRHGWIKN